MENASKALLIAGAILIVILLIAVGMLVYSQSRGVIDTGVTQMSSAEIQMFNAQFINYEGKQNQANIDRLYQTVKNSNIIYKEDQSKWIYVDLYRVFDYDAHGCVANTTSKDTYSDYKHLESRLIHHQQYISDVKGEKIYNVNICYGNDGLIKVIEVIQSGAEEYYINNR